MTSLLKSGLKTSWTDSILCRSYELIDHLSHVLWSYQNDLTQSEKICAEKVHIWYPFWYNHRFSRIDPPVSFLRQPCKQSSAQFISTVSSGLDLGSFETYGFWGPPNPHNQSCPKRRWSSSRWYIVGLNSNEWLSGSAIVNFALSYRKWILFNIVKILEGIWFLVPIFVPWNYNTILKVYNSKTKQILIKF